MPDPVLELMKLEPQPAHSQAATGGTRVAARRWPLARATCRGDAMAKKQKTLDDLFHETLKDIYYAEKKILTALPKMAKATHSDELRAAFEKHQAETEDQVDRLEQVFELMNETAKGKKCPAIDGIIEEGQEVMKEFKNSPAHDS